jgi:hypothetical protein
LSARSVFDASAQVRFRLAVIPKFLLAAIDATSHFVDRPLDAHVGGRGMTGSGSDPRPPRTALSIDLPCRAGSPGFQ